MFKIALDFSEMIKKDLVWFCHINLTKYTGFRNGLGETSVKLHV